MSYGFGFNPRHDGYDERQMYEEQERQHYEEMQAEHWLEMEREREDARAELEPDEPPLTEEELALEQLDDEQNAREFAEHGFQRW